MSNVFPSTFILWFYQCFVGTIFVDTHSVEDTGTYICGHSSANQKYCPVSYFDEHLILFGELTKEEKYRLFRDTSSLNLHSEWFFLEKYVLIFYERYIYALFYKFSILFLLIIYIKNGRITWSNPIKTDLITYRPGFIETIKCFLRCFMRVYRCSEQCSNVIL